ncbi:MAG: peptide chain release factor N(5)-glutamine methyltransferase [Desulfitobacteriaceae bacterium]
MKIIEGLLWGEAQLKSKGVEDPRLDADLLLADVLGLPRDRLYLERQRLLSGSEVSRYQTLVARRGGREPLQYILGRREFMGLDLYVDPRVLIPRADTETLAEKFLELVSREEASGLKILDLGTGSGALALVAAHYRQGARVVGTDLSEEALEVAQFNAQRLGIAVEWRQGDFLDPAREERWDWILSNPPYVSLSEYTACAPEIYFEPAKAFLGGEDGLDFYRRLAAEAPSLLTSSGRILLEIGWEQAREVCSLLQAEGLEPIVFPDLAGRDRVILAR